MLQTKFCHAHCHKYRLAHCILFDVKSLTSFQGAHIKVSCLFAVLQLSQTTCINTGVDLERQITCLHRVWLSPVPTTQAVRRPFWEEVAAMVVNYSATCCKDFLKGIANLQVSTSTEHQVDS